MDDTPPPDNFEKGIRFGCGFLFGGVLVFLLLIQKLTGSPSDSVWPLVLGAAFAFGLLAMRYGDPFWRFLSKCCEWFRLWWH